MGWSGGVRKIIFVSNLASVDVDNLVALFTVVKPKLSYLGFLVGEPKLNIKLRLCGVWCPL